LQGLLEAPELAGVTITAQKVSKEHLTGFKVEIAAGSPESS
jgi:hypothetical protein